MSHTRPAPAAMPPPQPPLPPKSTVLTGPNGRISAPPTEENRYAAAPTRSPRNQAKNRVTLGDRRPVGSSARSWTAPAAAPGRRMRHATSCGIRARASTDPRDRLVVELLDRTEMRAGELADL